MPQEAPQNPPNHMQVEASALTAEVHSEHVSAEAQSVASASSLAKSAQMDSDDDPSGQYS
jgi:hypothetical protein